MIKKENILYNHNICFVNFRKMNKKDRFILYSVIFYILFIVVLVLLTWYLTMNKKSLECSQVPNITCSNEWTCMTPCVSGSSPSTLNPCFFDDTLVGPDRTPWKDDGSTNKQVGLPECLYGINSTLASSCYGVNFTEGTGGTCPCSLTQMADSSSCLQGCPLQLPSGCQTTPT